LALDAIVGVAIFVARGIGLSWVWMTVLAVSWNTVGGAIDWDAPEACPSAEEVNERVFALVDDPHALIEAPVDVDVARVPTAPGTFEYRARVRPAGEEGAQPRFFAAQSCDAVANAVALFVAVRADVAEQMAEDEPDRLPVEVGLGIGGGAEYGALPGPTAGVRGRAALRIGAFMAVLYGEYWAPRRATRSGVSSAVDFGGAGAQACGVPGWERVTIPLCAGAEAGSVRSFATRGVDRDGEYRRPWVALTAAVGLRIRLAPRVGLWLGPELAVPILRQRFDIVDTRGGIEHLHLAAPFSVRGHVGIEFFPRR
jgi:hypothetical protein